MQLHANCDVWNDFFQEFFLVRRMNSTKQGRKGIKQGRNGTYDVWSEINHRISESAFMQLHANCDVWNAGMIDLHIIDGIVIPTYNPLIHNKSRTILNSSNVLLQ